MSLRELVREMVRAYRANDILTFAGAISFKVFFALIPLALFALAMLGGVGMQEVYAQEVKPQLSGKLSPAAFSVLNDTVMRVLEERQVWWMTGGFVVALWGGSGGVRAIMDVFDRIYCSEDERSAKERYLVSFALALAAGALLLAALTIVEGGDLLLDGPLGGLRYLVAIALLCCVPPLFVRFAPATPQSAGWVSFGSLVVVAAWLGTSIAFAAYMTKVADYGSIFGNLATIVITLQYFYVSSIAFLTGAQLDAIVRERLEGDPSGEGDGSDRSTHGRGNGEAAAREPEAAGAAS